MTTHCFLFARRLARFAASTVLVLAAAGAASAATITWTSPYDITGDADVSTTGTLIGAYGFSETGTATTTVNGVAFAPFDVPFDYSSAPTTVGNFTLTCVYRAGQDGTFSDQATPYSLLSASYQTLLGSGVYDGQNAMSLTMHALTIGQAYAFEFWSNDSSASEFYQDTKATAGNSVTLNSCTNALDGGLGQYVIGTFTADATSQVISFNSYNPSGNVVPLMNAFELRTAVVPEPSTWALLGVWAAGLGFGVMACRRRARF